MKIIDVIRSKFYIPYFFKGVFRRSYPVSSSSSVIKYQLSYKFSKFISYYKNKWLFGNQSTKILYLTSGCYDKNLIAGFLAPIESNPFIVYHVTGIYQVPPLLYNDPIFPILITNILLRLSYDVLAVEKAVDITQLSLHIRHFLETSDKIVTDYYYPIAQHMLACVFVRVKIDPSILSVITDNLIDYTYYNNAPISSQPVIEAFVAKKTICPLLKTYKIKAVAQNPDNPKGDQDLFRKEAYYLTKQPHPDIRTEVEGTLRGDTFVMFFTKYGFFDIKMRGEALVTTPLLRGHLCLVQKMIPTWLVNKFVGDFGTVLKDKPDIAGKEMHLLQNEIIKAKAIKKTISTEQDKLVDCQNLLNDIDSNPDIVSVTCSRIVEGDPNTRFDQYYENLDHQTLVAIEQIAKNLDIKALFPQKGQFVDTKAWAKALNDVVKLLPESRDTIDHNLKLLELPCLTF
jgi:hypothetical protein